VRFPYAQLHIRLLRQDQPSSGPTRLNKETYSSPSSARSSPSNIDGIVSAAVIGVTGDQWGEVPWAVVTLRDGASVSAESLRAHLEGKLDRYKLPKNVVVVDAPPPNRVGQGAHTRPARAIPGLICIRPAVEHKARQFPAWPQPSRPLLLVPALGCLRVAAPPTDSPGDVAKPTRLVHYEPSDRDRQAKRGGDFRAARGRHSLRAKPIVAGAPL
jgi:hypothetical protein